LKFIIDTHIYLWALADRSRLSGTQLDYLTQPANIIHVSSITVAEIAIKHSLGKLRFDYDPVEYIEASGFVPLDFSPGDGSPLREMPFHHRDPFDRMLIAQSLNRDLPVMSNDRNFRSYECRLVS